MPILKVIDVSRNFGEVAALDRISLEVGTGEAVRLCGPSGCGKTTLLRIIAGLLAPDSGEVWIKGRKVTGGNTFEHPFLRNIAVVFQEPRLWPHMTLRRNLEFGLAGSDCARRAGRVQTAAVRTGIQNLLERYPAELSAGQSRRAALARALAAGKNLVLLDEPLANLDPDSRSLLDAAIEQYWREEGFALLYVTHDPDSEAGFANRTLRIHEGKVCTAYGQP
jgi:iron(III) transport system ATP-binding protein